MRHADALAYVSTARIAEVPKGALVYSPVHPPNRLYLLVSGRVRIDRTREKGRQALVRIAVPKDFFGSCSLIPLPVGLPLCESALTMERSQMMAWSAEEIERQMEQQPEFGLALCTYFGLINTRFSGRISTLIKFRTGPRVAIAFIELARAGGKLQADGAMRLNGFTHQAFAEYVGTSRVIVTCEMNRLRRLGYISYTRLYTDVYVDALAERLRGSGMPVRGTQSVQSFAVGSHLASKPPAKAVVRTA